MLLLTLIIGLVLYFVIKRFFEIRDYPPGPYPLPIIGNGLQVGYYAWKTGSIVDAWKKFKEDYGPIFTLYFGPFPIINICDYELANEAMIKHGNVYKDRWEFPILVDVRKYHGLISSSGEYWVEQRRFALHTLRNLGVSRNIMEKRILEEWHLRFDNADPKSPFSVREGFDLFTGSVINRLLFSYRLDDVHEKEFTTLKLKMDEMMENLSILDTIIPKWALCIPYFRNRYDMIMEPLWAVKNFLAAQLKERIESVENGTHEISGEPSDFVDAFIVEMKKHEQEGVQSSFTLETLICDTFDLYLAGQDTTSSTLAWGVCFLLNYPEVIEKVHKELVGVTGGNRDLSQADKPKTPYFNATVHEIQRLASIVSANLNRFASEDLNIGGVTIKKGTAVTVQVSTIMSDERYFPDAKVFKPERYLESDKPEQHTVPFGMGKRACLGESLARAELYLILGNLIQSYQFEPLDGAPKMKEISPMSPLRRPPKFQIKLVSIDR